MSEIVKRQPKISIQICTHREMNPFFVNALRQMEACLNRNKIEYELSNEIGVSNLCGGRQHRVNDALSGDCTHILFLDDDMVFPQDTVQKMLHTANMLVTGSPDAEGKPTCEEVHKVAIGVNPPRKTMTGLYYTAKPVDSDDFMKSKGRMEVAEASRCGLSVLLVETALLREIPTPHFEITWNSDKNEHQGEDFYFIKKLREHGVRVFIDQELSQYIGHVGHYIYSYNSYPPEKADAAQT